MSVVVVATITPLPGEEDAVRQAILDSIPTVHEEPGCEIYTLHEGTGEFVMVERWGERGPRRACSSDVPAEALLLSGRRRRGRGCR